MGGWRYLLSMLAETARAVLLLIGLLLAFQLVLLRQPLRAWREIGIGLLLVLLGLFIFAQGLRFGLLPLTQATAESLAIRASVPMVVLFSLAVGYAATLTEPALNVMSLEVDDLTGGALPRALFTHTVAIGVALGLTVGSLRIVYGVKGTDMLVPALAILVTLTYFAPERYTSLAYDAALATTGPVTVPLVIALGVGLARALGREDVLVFGFGLVALAAIGPIVTVLGLGIILNILQR